MILFSCFPLWSSQPAVYCTVLLSILSFVSFVSIDFRFWISEQYKPTSWHTRFWISLGIHNRKNSFLKNHIRSTVLLMSPWHWHTSQPSVPAQDERTYRERPTSPSFPQLSLTLHPIESIALTWDEQRTIQIGKKWDEDHCERVHFPTHVLIYIIVFL